MNITNKFDENTKWDEVLNFLEHNNFHDKYSNYYAEEKEDGYILQEKNTNEVIFLFDEKRKIKIYDNGKVKNIEAFTSLDIDNYMKLNNLNINDIYFKNLNNIKYIDKIEDLAAFLKNNELEIKKKEPIPSLEYKKNLSYRNDYTPEEYSIYFYEYFIYEDMNKKNEKFIFEKNEIREIIRYNLLTLSTDNNLNIFKLTGPSSSGKSMTLFKICHSCVNMAYINLKVMNKYKDNFNTLYRIILTELERFNIINYLGELNDLIKKNYENNSSYSKLLINIMKYLNNLKEEKKKFVFIFDQFKYKYIEDGFLEEIQNMKKIKIVQCSSINDKIMREECIKSWLCKGKKIQYLNDDNQNYYFYFDSIYNLKNKDLKLKENDKKIMSKFSFFPKYIKLYEEKEDKNKFLEDMKSHIDNKISQFCANSKIDKTFLLTNLRFIINNDYFYEKLGEIIIYVPLKYFTINFSDNTFRVKPIFPFIKTIITHKLEQKECKDYFEKGLYKINTIEADNVKRYYFEAYVKFALKNLLFPKNKNYELVMLEDITTMEKIINDDNDELFEDEESNNNELNLDSINKLNNEEDKNNELHFDNIDILKNKEGINNEFNLDTIDIFKNKECTNDELNLDIISTLKDDKDNNNELKLDSISSVEDKPKNKNINIEEIKVKNYGNKIKDDYYTEEESESYSEEVEDNDLSFFYQEENYENKIIEKKKNNIENKDFDELLKNFGINSKKQVKFDIKSINHEIISLSKTIDDYRLSEIETQRKKKQIIEKSKFTGQESFFLDQRYKSGKTLDFAYLYGNKQNKKFIGFQIKCSFENSNLNNKAINKTIIRDNLQKILVNSMKLLNCKITEWHYFTIFYYNSEIKNENINKYNLIKYKINEIGYFFYEPIKNKFYESNLKRAIKEIKIDEYSNLDCSSANLMNYSQNIEKIFNEEKVKIGNELEKMIESFKKDLSYICKEKNPTLDDILNRIKTNIKVKNPLQFMLKCKIIKFVLVPPLKDFILLYKKKEGGFIAIKNNKDIIEYYDVETGEKLNYFHSIFDENSEYYYYLSILVRRKSSKKIKRGKARKNKEPKRNFLESKKNMSINDYYKNIFL